MLFFLERSIIFCQLKVEEFIYFPGSLQLIY